MTNKKVKNRILAAIFIVIWATMAISCKLTESPSRIYQAKIAAPVEYPAWLKRHTPIFGHRNASLKRANDFLTQSKDAAKKRSKNRSLKSKIEAINARAKELDNK